MKPAESPQLFRLAPRRCAARASSAEALTRSHRARSQYIASAALLASAAFLPSGTVFAQEPGPRQPELPLELDWSAPPDCASHAQVRAEMERIVRARPGFSLPKLLVNAEVRRVHTEYRVRLELTRAGETTQREFQAESCNAVVRAATLTIALAFGDGADISEPNRPEEQPKAAEPAPPASLPVAATPAPREPPAPNQPTAKERTLALGLGGAWSPHWLGGNAFGGQASAAARWPRAILTWTNRVWLPRTLHPTESASARFWAATTALTPGLHYRLGVVELELGLGLQIGVIRGSGADIRTPAQAWAPWYAIAPSVSAGFELGHGIRIVLGQEFVLTPIRPEFEIEAIGTVYRVPVLTPVTTLAFPIDSAHF